MLRGRDRRPTRAGCSAGCRHSWYELVRVALVSLGSRGDVQPYIALAKALLADGHRVKIATHGEFKEWIESVGLSTVALLLSF